MRGGPLSTRSLHALAGLYPLQESSQAADLTVTSYQSETSVDEELHHKRDHMPVILHSQKLQMKTTFPTSTVIKPQSHQACDQVTTYLRPKNGPIVERTYDWWQRSYDWWQRWWVIARGKSVATWS